MYEELKTYKFTCDRCKDSIIVHQSGSSLPQGWDYKYIGSEEELVLGGVLYGVNRKDYCNKCARGVSD